MAVIKKTLFPKNLSNYSVLVNDTDPNSKYFKISELSDTFTGGKNAFLIAGSEELVSDTKIQIELKDAAGNIIYHEPGEGLVSSSINGTSFATEYYEGVSKVVSVYIYPETAYGPCTLTILGELNQYTDINGINTPVPIDWENKYNVKWEKTINVNPSLANTTKIRFYQRPTSSITEILSPIYRIESGSKVNSGVSQSFADIKLSKLETFAGDVKRIKVFRTSQGDISDYDLIQDILVESKELLTSYSLTGSVVGQTGIFTSETLGNHWNTGSLNAYLTSSRVESGVRLTGSGNFTYTSSLDIKSANTYELNLDAFYSASTASNLGIYLSYTSASTTFSSSIATLSGIQPTKNLLDTTIPFKIDRDYPTASLYFSQSQGEWHLGNISLKLSQDTAFSPDEISFVTTMPTVIGNETFNFKFEFYDVNNNYVPVAVTQSATFTGGTNVGNTILLVSSSTSQSLAALYAVSTSISGTVTTNSASAETTITNVSSSVSGSIYSLSGSVSGTIGNVSSSVSGSIYSLSGSVANSLTLTSGSVTLLSGSFLQFTQSITASLTSLSQSVSSSFFNVSGAINNATASLSSSLSASLSYTVYSASQYLDKFIFTNEFGQLNQPPTASGPGLYLGSEFLGYYSASNWRTYMDNQGDFYLTSSIPGGGFMAWDSSAATLQVQGAINITGGNAATTTALSSSLTSVSGEINSATASLSSSLYNSIFTNTSGAINKPPNVMIGSPSGLYLGSTHLGFYNGTDWKTYMANNGNFYLSGAGSDSLAWTGGVLTINGAINITGGNAATSTQVNTAALNAVTSGSVSATNAVTSGSISASAAQSNAQSFATTAANNAAISASISGSVNAIGQITKPATPSGAGLYLGNAYLGYYNGSDWKTYMSSSGNFYLSGAGSDSLTWASGVLTINGAINVTGGNAATSAALTSSLASTLNSANSTAQGYASNAALSASISGSVNASGLITKPATPAGAGLYLGNSYLGYYNGSDWKTYMSSSGNFYLAGTGNNGLSWNGTDLSIDGNITARNGTFIGSITSTATISGGTLSGGTITGGTISIGSGNSIFKADTNGIYLGNATFGSAPFRVTPAGSFTATDATITGNIIATNITATTTGNIGGWDVTNNAISKSVGGVGRLVLRSTDNTISMYDTNENLRLQLNPTTVLPTLTTPGSSTTINANDGTGANTLSPGLNVTSTIDKTAVGIVLSATNNEIYVYFDDTRWIDPSQTPEVNVTQAFLNPNSHNVINAQYFLQVVLTGGAIVGELVQTIGYVKTDITGATFFNATIYTAHALFSNLPAGSYNLKVRHYVSVSKILLAGAGLSWYRWAEGTEWGQTDGISVLYGSSNAYSVLNAGGLVLSQGSQNYVKIATPTASADSFFEVRGRSTFMNGLFVSGALSANIKQFQITHPLDDKKWLYHTAIESPRADLIYRGVLQLENGNGNVDIDSASAMANGTFEVLTKNRQIFLQNNSGFDRVIGNITTGSLNIISENTQSQNIINWMVVAERNDIEIMSSKLYDSNGNYRPERYKEYVFIENLTSGSI